jgi:hypothetical protein
VTAVCICPDCPARAGGAVMMTQHRYASEDTSDEVRLAVPWGARSMIVPPRLIEFRRERSCLVFHLDDRVRVRDG